MVNTLFSGGLDIGFVALRSHAGQPGGGEIGKSTREISVEAARIDAARKARGSSPLIRNGYTVPPVFTV